MLIAESLKLDAKTKNRYQNMKRIFFLLVSTFFICNVALAEKVRFTASAPKVVEVGEQFRLSFSSNENGKNIQLPSIKGFQILMGPSSSSNISTQIINGKVTTNSSYTYTYILLAEKEGKYTIAPAEITVDGDQFKSNKLSIEVVKGNPNTNNSQANSRRQNNSSANRSQKITQENLFVRVELNDRSVYMGEQIIATMKIYTRLDLVNLGEIKIPSFDGFLTQDIPIKDISLVAENVNGVKYHSATIKKVILFPQHTGKIKIEPLEVKCVIRQRSKRRSRDFFDSFFDNYQDVTVPRKSRPSTVTVKDFPDNKPYSFDGAVGDFKLTASIDKDSVAANDAIALKVKISGNGNLKLIKPLDFDFPADFEVYDPTTKLKTKNTVKGSRGSTNFEYLIIPRHAGEYEIPSVEFSYFDPKFRAYKTRKTPSFKIKVGKGKGGDNVSETVINSFSKEDVKFIGKDIRFIKTNSFRPRIKGKVLFGTTNFYLAYIIPFLIFILAFIFNRNRIKANADIARVKNKRANKVAMKRLKAAAERLKKQEKEAFYDEILKALWGYTSDKLNLPLANLSKDNISEILLSKDVDQELITDFITILDTCEFARYAPSSGSAEMGQLYQKTMDTITKLEKSI
jgi:hypothetical protein